MPGIPSGARDGARGSRLLSHVLGDYVVFGKRYKDARCATSRNCG